MLKLNIRNRTLYALNGKLTHQGQVMHNMCHLVQAMSCYLFCAKLEPEPMLIYWLYGAVRQQAITCANVDTDIYVAII